MSHWTYIQGAITVSPMGRTQPEKRYILDTVLNHLPRVTGSEGDMDVYVIQKNGTNSNCSCDEFGQVTNNLMDRYGYKSRNGWAYVQDEYILTVDGSLRDREFKETYREFQRWLCRLAKRVVVSEVLVKIETYGKNVIVQSDNNNNKYGDMFENPSWLREGEHRYWKLNEKLKKYHLNEDKYKEPNWCEFMMYETVDGFYPRLLGYKYFQDEKNDKKVENWLDRDE